MNITDYFPNNSSLKYEYIKYQYESTKCCYIELNEKRNRCFMIIMQNIQRYTEWNMETSRTLQFYKYN